MRNKVTFILCLSSFVIGCLCVSGIWYGINRRGNGQNIELARIERERLASLERARTAFYNRNRNIENRVDRIESGLSGIQSGAVDNLNRIDRIDSREREIKAILEAAENRRDGD